MALGDGLEQRGLADVGETDDTTLQVVAGTTQEDLLFNGGLFGRHLLTTAAFGGCVVAGCDMEESCISGSGGGSGGGDSDASKRNGGVAVVVVGIGNKKGRTSCGR